jgi:hypothetical protein
MFVKIISPLWGLLAKNVLTLWSFFCTIAIRQKNCSAKQGFNPTLRSNGGHFDQRHARQQATTTAPTLIHCLIDRALTF